MAQLTTALGNYSYVAPLRDGSVVPNGHEFSFVELGGPIIGAFRRMVRNLEFDVCEMAITTYLSAKEYKKPFTAIPVFPVRSFPHRAIVANRAVGISSAKDFEGKRVGVRAYTVTTGVWARGVLADTYGVDLDRVTWVVADEEHVSECVLPGNVEYIAGANLSEMIDAGELARGIGVYQGSSSDVGPLVASPGSAEQTLVVDTGIYPINHMVVIKDSVLDDNPGIAASLYGAFTAAKVPFLDRLARQTLDSDEDKTLARRCSFVGPDPLPYGIEANRPTLEAIVRYAYAQKILSHPIDIEMMFTPGAES